MPRRTLVQVGRPYPRLTVKFQFRHVLTGGVTDFEDDFYVDTGFSEYLLLPRAYLRQLRLATGLNGSPIGRDTVAGPRRAVSLLFSGGEVTEISGYAPPRNIPIVVDCCGIGVKLFGRKLLDRWIAEIDGPKKLLALLSEEQ